MLHLVLSFLIFSFVVFFFGQFVGRWIKKYFQNTSDDSEIQNETEEDFSTSSFRFRKILCRSVWYLFFIVLLIAAVFLASFFYGPF